MGEIRRQLAQRDQLLRLLIGAGEVSRSIEQDPHAALGHGRDREQHFRKEVLVNIQHPQVTGAATFRGPCRHPRKG